VEGMMNDEKSVLQTLAVFKGKGKRQERRGRRGRGQGKEGR